MKKKNLRFRVIRNSILAILIVIGINFVVLYALDFPIMALNIISKYFILLIFLIGGFGFQVGLFTYLNHMSAIGCGTSAVSGGISGVSMILCCSHYLLNIVPMIGALVGFSALASLSKYTLYFLLFGIISNFAGIGIMFYQSKKKIKLRNENE